MSTKFVVQLVEQVVAVYVVTFVGALVANGFGLEGTNHLGVAAAAALSSIPAALMVIKSFAAKFVGDSDSALMIPKADSPSDPF